MSPRMTTAEQLHRDYVEAAGNAMRRRIQTGELTARERDAISSMTRAADEVIDQSVSGRDGSSVDRWPELASAARRMADRWAELTSCMPTYGGVERLELGARAWRQQLQDQIDRRKAVR